MFSKKSFKLFFRSLLTKYGSVETDKGVLYYDGEGELVVGMEVYVENNSNPDEITYDVAPDGEYVSNDTTFVVKDGKVDEIRNEKVTEEMADVPLEVDVETPFDAEEAIKMITEEMAAMKADLEAVKADLEALKAPIEGDVFNKFNKIKKVQKQSIFKIR